MHTQALVRNSSKHENRARKSLRTISIILGAFVICWTPWHVLSLLYGFCSSTSDTATTTTTLPLLNATTGPRAAAGVSIAAGAAFASDAGDVPQQRELMLQPQQAARGDTTAAAPEEATSFCGIPLVAYDISYWLCYLNSPLNPFCYALANQQFRRTFARILRRDWHRT